MEVEYTSACNLRFSALRAQITPVQIRFGKSSRSSNQSLWYRCPFLCHPASPKPPLATSLSLSTALPFLSSRVLDGPTAGLRPTQGDEKSLRPATTLYRTVAPSFVIPSEAEGSAVPRTFRGHVFRQSVPGFPASLHWTRPRMRLSLKGRRIMFDNASNYYIKSGVAERRDLCVDASSWRCFSTEVMKKASVRQLLSIEPLPPPLSSRAKPRDLRFRGPFVDMFFRKSAAQRRDLCVDASSWKCFSTERSRGNLRFRGPLLEMRILCNPLARKEAVSSSCPGKVPQKVLFCAQCLHWINMHSSTRREIAGCKSDEEQNNCY
jgi:hypothetical protein